MTLTFHIRFRNDMKTITKFYQSFLSTWAWRYW